MSTLHIVSKSPQSSKALARCLQSLNSNDGILLIEDGVYAASQPAHVLLTKNRYALQDDLTARGITADSAIQPIDYATFVKLCAQYEKTVSWF